jgi:hypothetical protein
MSLASLREQVLGVGVSEGPALLTPPRLSVSLAVFALFVVLELLQRWAVLRPAERAACAQRELTRESRELRRRAAELNAPQTFAQSAKLARQAALKEKEVEHLRASAAAHRRRAPALAKWALQLAAVAALWGAPVLIAPGPPLGWPLDGWLAATPLKGAQLAPGAVGALPFALLCGRVASLLARVLLPS